MTGAQGESMLDSMSTPIDTQTCTDLLAQKEKKEKNEVLYPQCD